MKYRLVEEAVARLRYIQRPNAKMLYDFIVKHEIRQVLELGFAHGVSSCFIAAALDEVSSAHGATTKLTTIDLPESRQRHPPIELLLLRTGLQQYVDVHRIRSGYHWFLHDEIRVQSAELNRCRPKYDLVIHDCTKNWMQLSGGFFLIDKLLKPGGWIIWDDFNWTFSAADKKRNETFGTQHSDLSRAELETPHVREMFYLLVMQHPNYQDFKIVEDSNWAWARKRSTEAIVDDNKRVEIMRSHSFSWYGGRVLRDMRRAFLSLRKSSA